MFICSECGTKYEIMPKFCDCGNDIFIEENEPIAKSQYTESAQEKPRRKGRGKVESFSPVAIGAFAFCLILSLVILFFIGNPQKEIILTENRTGEKSEDTIEIPKIETFWDNTLIKAAPKENTQEPSNENPIIEIMPKFMQNIIPQESVKKNQTQAITKNPSPTRSTINNNSGQNKTPQLTSKPQTSKSTNSSSPVNQQAQAVTNRIKNNIQYNNPNTTTPNSSVQTSTPTTPQSIPQTQTKSAPQLIQNSQNTITPTPAPTPVVKTKSQTELTKELNTYKASLRNTIGRRIDFTKVVGDGDCALSFKINSGGKLISRTFTKQSSNITLNDAVYSAMNSTTNYNPPPEGYKGETLNLKIKFYNGNFEITLY